MKGHIFKIFLFAFAASMPLLAAAGEDSVSENMLVTAVEKYAGGKADEASAILKEIIAANPDDDAAHYYLGLCEVMNGNTDGAEAELRKAVQADTTNFWYRYRLATLYSMTGKEELTLAMFENLVRDFPKKYDLYYNMVELYAGSGQNEKALETMSQIEAVFGKNEMTALTRFDLLRKMGRQDEAYASLEEYNKEYSSPQVLSLLGDRELSMYNEEKALALYDEALSLSSDYTPALLGKAEVYRMTRRYDEFFALIGDFVRDQNVPAEGKCKYLDVLTTSSGQNFVRIFKNQLDSLMTECETFYPGDSTVNFTAGKYYYATGRGEQAKARFRDNMDRYPSSLSAAANYVELLMYLEQWDSLAVEGRKAYGKFPGETAFLELAGVGEYNLGNYREVINIYDEVLKAAEADSAKVLQAYTAIGDMYFKVGETKKAFKAYDNALEVNPDYAPVLNNYAYFLSLENKKLKKACSMSKKTVDQEPGNATYLDTYGWILFLQGKPQEAKPVFKNAIMLYGGKENAEILDHYAEVLFSLGEYDLAFLYWSQAKAKNNGEIKDLDARISLRKTQMNKSKK